MISLHSEPDHLHIMDLLPTEPPLPLNNLILNLLDLLIYLLYSLKSLTIQLSFLNHIHYSMSINHHLESPLINQLSSSTDLLHPLTLSNSNL